MPPDTKSVEKHLFLLKQTGISVLTLYHFQHLQSTTGILFLHIEPNELKLQYLQEFLMLSKKYIHMEISKSQKFG